MKIEWKMLAVVVFVAVVATALALNNRTRGQVVGVLKQLSQVGSPGGAPSSDKSWIDESATRSRLPWDHIVTVNDRQVEAIGLKTTVVKQQTEPTILKLLGVTDYDPATVTIVRTQFDSRVEKVLVDLGTPVKQGDALLELFSTDLADAKSNYEAAISQWERDKKVLDYKTPLANDNTLPRKELIEVVNDEAQSRLKMKLAKDKLLVYGLTEKEIEKAKGEDGVQKARMTLRSRADGVVVLRSVVPGNYYDSTKELMTIAPLDHLWVRGSVSELDADQVEKDQKLRINFPFSNREIDSTVSYIDKAIDSDSRSAKFRTTIKNPEGKLKAGMFVRIFLDIPPIPGNTLIPRIAMLSVDRYEFVFVKKPGKGHRFERRQVSVVKENNDFVIVAKPSLAHSGLTPGEEVVTIGSLILEQIYEDMVMTEGGLLAEGNGPGSASALGEALPIVAKTPAAQ